MDRAQIRKLRKSFCISYVVRRWGISGEISNKEYQKLTAALMDNSGFDWTFISDSAEPDLIAEGTRSRMQAAC